MDENNKIIKDELIIDDEHKPILLKNECKGLKSTLTGFVACYEENKDKPVEAWLGKKMQEQLPDKKPEEIAELTNEIITTLKIQEENRASLDNAISNGRSKESWFADAALEATSAMSAQEASKYLASLDDALKTANDSLKRTITTQSGAISQNPSLDGFIAEQYHAQTFNMNAEATGSPYRAKVLEPTGNGYAKNSVDIVIVDAQGKVVRRYQSKYCKDAKATEQAFEQGDYRGQRKLVPEGQEGEMKKNASTIIEAPDGTTSNPLSKSHAEQMRDEAQSGNWNELNWNEYAAKDLAVGIAKQTGRAALQGAAIGVGMDIAQKLWNDEEIEASEVVKTALKSGADFGVKAAVAGALKVGVEKEIITVIPKGTPAGTIANIAYVAIEDIKVIDKIISEELSFKEGVEKLEETTVSTVAGLVMMSKGAAIGATIGTVFGFAGNAIGGFVGGIIGYMAGSKSGQAIIKGAQKIRDGIIKAEKYITSKAGNAKNKFKNKLLTFLSN